MREKIFQFEKNLEVNNNTMSKKRKMQIIEYCSQ